MLFYGNIEDDIRMLRPGEYTEVISYGKQMKKWPS
jgi:hypothetical protein